MSKKLRSRSKNSANKHQKELKRKKKVDMNKRSRGIHIREILSLIRKFDDPVLLQSSEAVAVGEDLSFVETMKKVLCSTPNGVGLAACQIGKLKNAIVLRFDPEINNVKVMINPVMLSDNGKYERGTEGCLSYPGLVADIERLTEITIEYLDEDFRYHKATYTGFRARVLQHEVDHLLGTCALHTVWEKQKLDKQYA